MSLLLLAGTGEASALADCLAAERAPFAVWLPEGPRLAREWPCCVYRGSLSICLAEVAPTAILDASHPFAADISHAASSHSAKAGLPYCLLLRPEWRAQPSDLWTHVTSEAGAVQHIAPGSLVFAASGREGLARFAALQDCYIYCRQIGAPDAPFPLAHGEWLVQQPPFTVESEIALFRRLRIDWLVLRNAGSVRAETKLTAARALGVQVAMIARPVPPDAPRVHTVEAALAWVAAL
jgi:precorrin-6A/cobalt-precorrin-6A reductase